MNLKWIPRMTLPAYDFGLPHEELNCDALNIGGVGGALWCVISVISVANLVVFYSFSAAHIDQAYCEPQI